MLRTLSFLLLIFLTFPMGARTIAPGAGIVVDRTRGTADVQVVHALLSDVIQLASLYSGIFVDGEIPHRRLSMSMDDVPVGELVERIAGRAGLTFVSRNGRYLIVNPRERRVSLDVVDEGVRDIVESLARQCGIRNVMIDAGMEQTGTFRFEGVPCQSAFRVVFETMRIDGELHTSSVLVVRAQR